MELAIAFLFSYVIALLGIGVVGWILYLFYVPFERRLIRADKLTPVRSKQIKYSWLLFILSVSAYFAYNSVFPGESFYRAEFEMVTRRLLPRSAKFISKSASFPDHHGDYCSSAQISLSKQDYMILLNELKQDSTLTNQGKLLPSHEFASVLGQHTEDDIVYRFERKIPGGDNHYLFIGFCRDTQTVFVNVKVS